MYKKLISVLLSVILVISCLAVPAFAAGSENSTVKKNDIEAMAKRVFAGFIGKPDAEISIDGDLISRLKSGKLFGVSAFDLAEKLSDYVLVDAEQLDANTANKYGSYTVVTLENGVKTVYIAVNIAEHPELYKLDCFHDAVTELVAGQKNLVSGENATLMDYNRVAGELALHMIVYGVTAPIVKLSGDRTASVIKNLFDQAKVADLNIDESRVPSSLIRIIGGFSDFLYRISFGLFR